MSLARRVSSRRIRLCAERLARIRPFRGAVLGAERPGEIRPSRRCYRTPPVGRDQCWRLWGAWGPPLGFLVSVTQLGTRACSTGRGSLLRSLLRCSQHLTESEAAQVAAACPRGGARPPGLVRLPRAGPPQLGCRLTSLQSPLVLFRSAFAARIGAGWSLGRPVSPAAPGSQAPLCSAPGRSWRPGAGHTDPLLSSFSASLSTSRDTVDGSHVQQNRALRHQQRPGGRGAARRAEAVPWALDGASAAAPLWQGGPASPWAQAAIPVPLACPDGVLRGRPSPGRVGGKARLCPGTGTGTAQGCPPVEGGGCGHSNFTSSWGPRGPV